MLLRVVPEEGQDVLPEDSTPWAKELRSPTSHSNRSLRTEVSVAGKRNFQGRDKEAETALEIQGRRCRDKISLGNSANSGLIAGFREISVRTRMRGGAERTSNCVPSTQSLSNRSVASEASTDLWNVELWSDPVDTQSLLQKISAKIRKYIVLRPEALIATALWTMTAWAHEGAAHSPILAAISVEPDSGKSTLLGVLRFLVPKPFVSVEPTGPSVYRTVDREHPTLIIDEADDLFYRKSDLRAIVNAGWSCARGFRGRGVGTIRSARKFSASWARLNCPAR